MDSPETNLKQAAAPLLANGPGPRRAAPRRRPEPGRPEFSPSPALICLSQTPFRLPLNASPSLITPDALSDYLVLLALLASSREALLGRPQEPREAQRQVPLKHPGHPDVCHSKPDQGHLIPPAHGRQLHKLLQPMRRGQHHVHRYAQCHRDCRHERPCLRVSIANDEVAVQHLQGANLQFCSVPCRNGGPAFRSTPDKTYSKHDTKNKAVFSEFLILDSSCLTLGGMYQLCCRTVTYATAWMRIQMPMRPRSGVKTLRDTKSAVGRFRHSLGAGPAHPMNMAMGNIRRRSMKRN